VSLTCTEVFLWLSHQNLGYPENFWYNVWNCGGHCPHCLPLATRSEVRSIFDIGDCIPASSGRLRKARIACRSGGQRSNPEHLTRVAKNLMQDQPHIVFIPKQAQSTYITVLFWVTCDDQQLCSRMRHACAVQQEVLNQGVKLKFQVECVFALKNYLVYVVDKSSDYKLLNAKQPLPNEDDQAQFESVLETLHSLKTVEMPCAKRLRTH